MELQTADEVRGGSEGFQKECQHGVHRFQMRNHSRFQRRTRGRLIQRRVPGRCFRQDSKGGSEFLKNDLKRCVCLMFSKRFRNGV